MDSVDKFFRHSHYNIVRVLLCLSGLWPFYSTVTRCAIFLGFLVIVGSGYAFEVLGMIDVWPDIFEVIDCIPLLIYPLLTVGKVICIACTLPKIEILLIKMQEHWTSPKSNRETEILRSNAIFGRKFGYAYTIVLYGHSVLFLCSSLLTKFYTGSNQESEGISKAQGAQAGVPYRVNYIVDLDMYYIPIYLHTVMCEMAYMTFLCAVDVLYLTSIQYYCGLVAALRYILENAYNLEDDIDDIDDLLQNVTKDDKSYSIIAYSIRRHNEAIQFVNILESLYSVPLLYHMGCVVSIMSIVGFQVITNTTDMSRLIRHFIYFSAAVVNTFFENWQGQRLIDSSEKLFESAYNVKWYYMPYAARKLLVLFMLRSMQPSQITAGKMVAMSFENFNAVMRTTSSYFMLLRSMQ